MAAEDAGTLAPGDTTYLGATPDAAKGGTNFVFYAGKDARAVDLCVFDKPVQGNETRYHLTRTEEVKDYDGNLVGHLWSGHAPEVKTGALYGFRIDGPFEQSKHDCFNYNKLLVDPSAKAVTNEIHEWDPRHFPNNTEDNADIMPKARVVDWQALHRAAAEAAPVGDLNPYADSNILQMHIKGGTLQHKQIPESERGKFSALANPLFIKWVKKQKYTSIELLPPGSFGTDGPVAARGKINHWGFQPMVFNAPHTGYASGDRPEEEYQQTIATLKQNGIEVVMHLVPNHTLEGGAGGPAVNLRGMDDTLYHYPADGSDWTGAGNTRDFGHPINVRLFLEEMKYWRKMGVSGFRVDLATIAGRMHGGGFDNNSPVMRAMREEPELKDVKLYVEPYDLGPYGHHEHELARVPKPADAASQPPGAPHDNNVPAEWDPFLRDNLRAIALNGWQERMKTRGEIARVIANSAEDFEDPQRRLAKTGSHDGATREDMVTVTTGKNNHWHGENNQDGNHIDAANHWESPDDRARVQRFADALLAVTQGGVLTVAGDDRRHTQDGDTNLYCVDKDPASPRNSIASLKWGDDIPPDGQQMMHFKRKANAFRAKHPSLHRGTNFTGGPDDGSGLRFNGGVLKDVTWLDESGRELDSEGMKRPGGLTMMLSGEPGNSPPDEMNHARKVVHERDKPLAICINATLQDMEFTLPDVPGVKWQRRLDSCRPGAIREHPRIGNDKVTVGYHSLVAFEALREKAVSPDAHRQALAEQAALPGQQPGAAPGR